MPTPLLLVHFTTPFPRPEFLSTLKEDLRHLREQNYILFAACPWPELLKPTVDALEQDTFYNADDCLNEKNVRRGKWGFEKAYVVGEDRGEIIRFDRDTPLHLRNRHLRAVC